MYSKPAFLSTLRSPSGSTAQAVAGYAVALTALAVSSSCALLDPTAYGFVYGPDIQAAEGRVSEGDGLQQGHWRYKGDNDQVLSEGDYVDDVRTGPWADYYENGNPKYLYTLKDSSRHGLFQSFHPNAKLETAGYFVCGYQFGQWNFYDRAGRLAEAGAFANDRREGRWTKFHPDGSPKLTELHFNGERVGHWELTDTEGEVTDIWNDMPEGIEWVSEVWPGADATRREGFLQDGRPVGLWKSFHRDGLLRSVGSYDAGRAAGPWHFYSADAELIARGSVEGGRPVGDWTVASNGSSQVVDARTTFRSGLPLTGEWSAAALVQAESIGVVVHTWMEETSSSVEPEALVSQLAPVRADGDVTPEPLAPEALTAIEASAQEPTVPVPTHAFTQKEQLSYPSLVSYYGGEESAANELRSLYRGSRSSSKASAAPGFPELEGDVARAQIFVGKKLPMTAMRSADGKVFDLNKRRGQKIVLVLLRGFDGEICPYCVAQTKALCDAGALQEFKDRNVALEVVFPGSEAGLAAFEESYRTLNKKTRRAYGMRYADAFDVATKFDLPGEKVQPATLIVDERGIVRFAYVGKTVEDRPTLPLLLEEIDRMDRE